MLASEIRAGSVCCPRCFGAGVCIWIRISPPCHRATCCCGWDSGYKAEVTSLGLLDKAEVPESLAIAYITFKAETGEAIENSWEELIRTSE